MPSAADTRRPAPRATCKKRRSGSLAAGSGVSRDSVNRLRRLDTLGNTCLVLRLLGESGELFAGGFDIGLELE